MQLPQSIQQCIEAFSQLPTVGRKSAERFVFYLLQRPQSERDAFAEAVKTLSQGVTYCAICKTLSEQNPCETCSDQRRNKSLLCIIATSRDRLLIENTNTYHGLYHILGGTIDAINNITPDKLNIESLKKRLAGGDITEVILALNPNFNGETTALYLTNILKNYMVKITYLARGLPIGSDIQYADERTLSQALHHRTEGR